MPCSKTADAYLISFRGAEKMCKNMIPFYLPIDYMMNPIFLKNNFDNYWCDPPIIHQGSVDVYKSSALREGS